MGKPVVVLNLKTYQSGKDALKLAKVVEKFDSRIIIGAQSVDISRLSKETRLKVFAQHVDGVEPGRHTGFIVPQSVKLAGAKGVFLNHSEHPLDFDAVKKAVMVCRKLKLAVYLFAKDLKQAKKFDSLKPDYIIYEPKELVAGKVSVTDARPDVVKKITASLKTKVLIGAGIHKKEDVAMSLALGASGVALSSAITTAKNPKRKLQELFG